MTFKSQFGGAWTQQKLSALDKYLQAYTTIFKGNPKARFYSITYVDAFAGTGTIRRPELGGFADFLPELRKNEEEFRKGSVIRAVVYFILCGWERAKCQNGAENCEQHYRELSRGHRIIASIDYLPIDLHSGIFPCFFSGFLSRFVSSMASA